MSHSKMPLKYVFLYKHFGATAAQIVDISRFYYKTLSYILWQNANIGTDIIIIQLGFNIYFARSAIYLIHRNN